MKSLREFYNDSDTRENVHNYLIDFLEKETIKRVFERTDVSAIADAKEIIDKAFENLNIMFELKSKEKESINQAR